MSERGGRNFLLNERHELEPGQKSGGGRPPKLGKIDWPAKSVKLTAGFGRARAAHANSRDPVAQRDRFFITALPATIPRYSEKDGKREDREERASFQRDQSADLQKLGLDVIAIGEDGTALVHVPAAKFGLLERTAAGLDHETARSRNRWLGIEDIQVPGLEWRVEPSWLSTLTAAPVECIVELAPVLDRGEAEKVISAIFGNVQRAFVTGFGADYSGRLWWRANLNREQVSWIAQEFLSIQLIHPPFGTALAVMSEEDQPVEGPQLLPERAVGELPVVGLVDDGLPQNHPVFRNYMVTGWRTPGAAQPIGPTHASGVATRLVFGRAEEAKASGRPATGVCRVLDIVPRPLKTPLGYRLDDKDIVLSMANALGVYPNLRTFVCSFDTVSTSLLRADERAEKLRQVRDLDNFIFDFDVVVVMAAGNTKGGPSPLYPKHYDVPAWQLGPWASTHNTLTCGGFVDGESDSPLAGLRGAPSPFTRVGPGFAGAAGVPDGAAHAGGEQKGVLIMDDYGYWHWSSGTSYAAPLLAREVARAFAALQPYCSGTVASALVKAFLHLTARSAGNLPAKFRRLAKRALGAGQMSADRLLSPTRQSAVFLWQGTIEGPDDLLRVLVPVPTTWLRRAKAPRLRLVLSWNTHVNETAFDLWSCRRVEAQLHAEGRKDALRATIEKDGGTYPKSVRTYDLADVAATFGSANELTLGIAYKTLDMAPELNGLSRPAGPQQPAAFAAELYDESGETNPFDEVVHLEQTNQIAPMDRLRAVVVPTLGIGVR